MTTVPTVPTRERTSAPIQRPGVVGTTTVRVDGIPKVKGEFEYSSDIRMDGMLWGATLRSAHPPCGIWSVDVSRALAIPGVRAVLTHEDVPGRKLYGMERADQPVLAWQHVRYQGEPIAIVAAEHPETARRAIDAIEVDYEVLEPLTDPERAMAADAPQLHLRATFCATSGSRTAIPTRSRPTSSSPATTRSGCRTRRSSVPSRVSRSRTARAASISTSPPSGCTSTATSSPSAWTCRRRRCG